MQDSQIPVKISVYWAQLAGGAYVRTVPDTSQIGINDGYASFSDGFVPLNMTPIASGGTPPFGQDMNGALRQITQWLQWGNSGGQVQYDSGFSTSVGGYPKGAVVASTTLNKFWINQVDNNTVDPDGAGTNWQPYGVGNSGVTAGSYSRPTITIGADGRVTAASTGSLPTYQRVITGSGTLTPSAGVVRWKVKMAGGGGSGGFNNSASGNAGGSTSLASWTAIGGSAGAAGGAGGAGGGGNGGSGGSNGSGALIKRVAGGNGQSGSLIVITVTGGYFIGGTAGGGVNQFGGGISGSGVPGTGAGGSGAGNGSSAGSTVISIAPGGGGAGEYVEFYINSPSALAYSVGAGGVAPTGGSASGGSGSIEIEEIYA